MVSRKMENKTNIKKIVFFIIFMLLSFSFFACNNNEDESNIIEETPPTTEQTIEKFVITETKDGKINTVLEAESAVIDENKKMVYLMLPKVKFYQDGKFMSILISETGEINLENNNIKALGKCTLDTVENEHLQTRDVSYDAATKIISSDNDIKITRKTETIYGKGFKSDVDLNKIIIKKQRVLID